ncbi:MAG: hypothetical protein IBJ10_09690, partial [Phycisphaerales bacterium]|nr:hypothetical protein [Phycisphaerales bacterium]
RAVFLFMDPPYSTHIDYSDDPACIGRLDAGAPGGRGQVQGAEYYRAMEGALREAHRVLRDRRYMAIYVSDSFKKRKAPALSFMPIGFELFSIARGLFKPVDIVAVVRQNAKLRKGNWHKAAEEENFFLRGFNYLLIFKKESDAR